MFRRAIANQEKRQASFVDYYEDQVRVYAEYGNYLYEQKRYSEAEPLWRQAVVLARKNLGCDSTITKLTEVHLAMTLLQQKDPIKRKEADALVNSVMDNLADLHEEGQELTVFQKETELRQKIGLLNHLKSGEQSSGSNAHDQELDKRTTELLRQRQKILQSLYQHQAHD